MFNRDKSFGKKYFFRKGFFFLLTAAAALLLLGALVFFLWNAILPPVTGLAPLNYWQAVGLLLLSRLLFGSFPGRRYGGPSPKAVHWREKWASMNDEEKARFREAWKDRCRRRDKPTEEL